MWPFYHDWNCPRVAEFPLMVKRSHNMCTVYIVCRTIMLKDKINCGGGFVNYFLWVPLICLGSMTQGTRAGTFVEPCKNSLQNLLQSSFCLLLFSPYLSQESTCERWRTKKETIRARAAPQTSRPSLRAVWLLRCPIATMADIPTPSKLFYSAINTLVFPRLFNHELPSC